MIALIFALSVLSLALAISCAIIAANKERVTHNRSLINSGFAHLVK